VHAFRSLLARRRWLRNAAILPIALGSSGCVLERYAQRELADALASGGSSFATEEDVDLVRDAAPFSLKLCESVLEQNPRHADLLLATARGYAQYAYAFLQQEADVLEESDLAAAERLRLRARRLYLRARDYGLRGLEVEHEGFAAALRADPVEAVRALRADDVPLAYWTAAAWGSAIALSKDEPHLVAEQPVVQALIDRALALDEDFDSGAIHAFLIAYEPSRPGAARDADQRVEQHFARAVELSHGLLASPYVTLAETLCTQNQDRARFDALLAQALAVDVGARREWRLENAVAQERARWLLAHADRWFLEE
jgi:predicted anti-sigma-YlaC factor YlaD